MRQPHCKPNALALLGCALAGLALFSSCTLVVQEVLTDCGDSFVEGLETCDGSDFAGLTCGDFGFIGGNLICNPYCRLETDNCNNVRCGDGECDIYENQATCPGECPEPIECGDWKCDASELGGDCPADCEGVRCGDGYCNWLVEGPASCPSDCGGNLFCGDGFCADWEMGTCPEDCDDPICDEDEECEPDRGENDGNCIDCAGLADCGNGTCDPPDETVDTCPSDCSS
ncbi:MAG: hypothetical protein RBU30_08425 [Polyangia bacterium]|jgi:hypothetical protein|nr:hypothetical protein [Polyangia bacterium]